MTASAARFTVSFAVNPLFGASATPIAHAGPASAVISGGSGSYTGVWTPAVDDLIVVDSQTVINATFTASGLAPGDTRTGFFTLTVTDTITGQIAVSDTPQEVDMTGF